MQLQRCRTATAHPPHVCHGRDVKSVQTAPTCVFCRGAVQELCMRCAVVGPPDLSCVCSMEDSHVYDTNQFTNEVTCDLTTDKEAAKRDAATQAPSKAVGIAYADNEVFQLGEDTPAESITTPRRASTTEGDNKGLNGDYQIWKKRGGRDVQGDLITNGQRLIAGGKFWGDGRGTFFLQKKRCN